MCVCSYLNVAKLSIYLSTKGLDVLAASEVLCSFRSIERSERHSERSSNLESEGKEGRAGSWHVRELGGGGGHGGEWERKGGTGSMNGVFYAQDS